MKSVLASVMAWIPRASSRTFPKTFAPPCTDGGAPPSALRPAIVPANAGSSMLSRDCREGRLSANAEPKRRRRRYRRLVIMVLLDKLFRVPRRSHLKLGQQVAAEPHRSPVAHIKSV